MGDIADMMMDGFLDSETGEFIDGDSPGYPRTMDGPCWAKCEMCGKQCKSEDGLAMHVKTKHKTPRFKKRGSERKL